MVRSNNPIAAATIVRLFSSAAAGSLVVACFILALRAPTLHRPIPQFFVAGLTLLAALLVLYGGSLALKGRRGRGIVILGGVTGVLILLTIIRFVPGIFRAAYLMDIEALFPPLWVYCATIPLLLFLIFELTLQGRGEGDVPADVPIVSLFAPLVASMVVLFIGATIVGMMATAQLSVPIVIFNGFLTTLVLVALTGLGAILPRKGMQMEGMALLVVVGLLVESLSILFYADIPKFIPHFIPPIDPWRVFDGLLPVLPMLGGTLPGAVITLSGLGLLWSTLAQQSLSTQPVEQVHSWDARIVQGGRKLYRAVSSRL